MANKPRMKMPVSERAKQFMPFSALKGLEEALAEKERRIVEKRELSEESADTISRTLNRISVGNFVKVVHYSLGEYVSTEGLVASFDEVFKKMTVVKTEIAFDDIYEVSVDTKQENQ